MNIVNEHPLKLMYTNYHTIALYTLLLAQARPKRYVFILSSNYYSERFTTDYQEDFSDRYISVLQFSPSRKKNINIMSTPATGISSFCAGLVGGGWRGERVITTLTRYDTYPHRYLHPLSILVAIVATYTPSSLLI